MKKKQIFNWDEVPLVLGTDLVSLILGIKPNTLTKLCLEGSVPAFKVGRLWKFEKTALREFMEGNKNVEASCD